MARIKTDDERGPVGAWAYHAREDADLSDVQVVERLARKGIAVHPATIRGIEGGTKKPGRRLLRELAAIYESTPPGSGEAATAQPDLGALVIAMTRAMEAQAVAFSALAEQFQVAVALSSGEREGLLSAVADLRRELEAIRRVAGSGAGTAPQQTA